jgi:hypothetical protein
VHSQVDQATGIRGRPEVLLALAQYRRLNGRMHFGLLLAQRSAPISGTGASGSSISSGSSGMTSPDGAGGSASGAGQEAEAAAGVTWLRERFGRVLCVGDTVHGFA